MDIITEVFTENPIASTLLVLVLFYIFWTRWCNVETMATAGMGMQAYGRAYHKKGVMWPKTVERTF